MNRGQLFISCVGCQTEVFPNMCLAGTVVRQRLDCLTYSCVLVAKYGGQLFILFPNMCLAGTVVRQRLDCLTYSCVGW